MGFNSVFKGLNKGATVMNNNDFNTNQNTNTASWSGGKGFVLNLKKHNVSSHSGYLTA
jgi:ribosomal protein L3